MVVFRCRTNLESLIEEGERGPPVGDILSELRHPPLIPFLYELGENFPVFRMFFNLLALERLEQLVTLLLNTTPLRSISLGVPKTYAIYEKAIESNLICLIPSKTMENKPYEQLVI